MSRFIQCDVKIWNKIKQKHIIVTKDVWKYYYWQFLEMRSIYTELGIGQMMSGYYQHKQYSSKFIYTPYGSGSGYDVLILYREDVPKINQYLKEMRELKYEYDFMMIEAIRNFICEHKKQDEFVFISE